MHNGSTLREILKGVPQVSVLFPLVYNIFIISELDCGDAYQGCKGHKARQDCRTLEKGEAIQK